MLVEASFYCAVRSPASADSTVLWQPMAPCIPSTYSSTELVGCDSIKATSKLPSFRHQFSLLSFWPLPSENMRYPDVSFSPSCADNEYIWCGGVTESRFRSPLLSEAWEHGRLCSCHGRCFCRKTKCSVRSGWLKWTGMLLPWTSLPNSSYAGSLLPLSSVCLSIWPSAVVFNIKVKCNLQPPASVNVRQIKQSDPCRALRGCSLLVSPLQRVSWGRSNPIKPQLYLQIIP